MSQKNIIKKYWVENHVCKVPLNTIFVECPIVRCADGFEMSVQASEFHYCSPRTYLKDGSYSSFEIGFPSQKEPLIMDYIDDPEAKPTETVYGYVPTKIINQVIQNHGGLKDD